MALFLSTQTPIHHEDFSASISCSFFIPLGVESFTICMTIESKQNYCNHDVLWLIILFDFENESMSAGENWIWNEFQRKNYIQRKNIFGVLKLFTVCRTIKLLISPVSFASLDPDSGMWKLNDRCVCSTAPHLVCCCLILFIYVETGPDQAPIFRRQALAHRNRWRWENAMYLCIRYQRHLGF